MKFSSQWSIISIYTGLIVVFAAIIILSSTLTSRQALLGHARSIMTNIASYTMDKSSNYLLPARDAARLTRGLAKSNILSKNDHSAMEAYFYEQLFIYPQFSGIYFGTVDGEFIMASRYNKFQSGGYFSKIITKKDGKRTVDLIYRNPEFKPTKQEVDPTDTYDPRARPWFQTSQKRKTLTWTAPYVFFTSKQPGITTANPVYGPDGKLRGVIGVDIALNELSTFLSKLRVSEHGLAFIMDTSGNVVAYPDLEKIKMPAGDKLRLTTITELDDEIARKAYATIAPKNGTPLDLGSSIFTSFDHDGQTYHAMFAPFTEQDWPWIIGIYLPENDYLGTIKKNSVYNIGIAVIAIILGGLFGLLVARKLNRHRCEAESAAATKSHFLARMSHEIRTPMNALLGASELLRETKLSAKQQKYLDLFQNAGNVLHDLVSDILDFSVIEAGKVTIRNTPFTLRKTMEETCSVLSLGAKEKGLEFVYNVGPLVPEQLIGDAARIKQVLVNLIANAIKFTNKGMVEVRCDTTGTMDGTNITLAFSVRDTGIGISEKMQESVFNSFSQGDQCAQGTQSGTGLGLAISRHLVELMGGRITLSSQQGKGSTFRFLLPLKVCGQGKTASPETPQTTSNAPRLKVLLADGDESNRLILDMFIRSAGHQPTMLTDGQEVVKAIAEQAFDLLLLDIETPEMNGVEIAKRIRKMEQENGLAPIRIIALAKRTTLSEHADATCFTAQLVKPVKMGDLLALLKRDPEKNSPAA